MKKTLLFILLLVNVYSVSAYTTIGHYRWRNDDGNETTATWKGALDTPLQISIHDIDLLRLRVEIKATNDVTIDSPILEYSKDDGATWVTMDPLGYYIDKDFYMSKTDKVNYIDVVGDYPWVFYHYSPTTQQISTGTSFVAGRVVYIDYGDENFKLSLAAGQSTEFEYTIKPTGAYIGQLQKYIFRVKGVTGLLSQTPTLIIGDCFTIPSAPTANAEQTFCFGTNPIIANLAVADTNLQWFDAAADGSELPTNTALVDGNVYYCQKFSYCTVGVPRTAITARIPDNSVTTNVSICDGDSYTWLINGITYTTSGNYTFVKDCHTENLNLTVNLIPVPNAIDNQIFKNNQVTQPIVANKICAIANEGQNIQLTAPAGFVFTEVPYASFGTPDGTCGNFTLGSCHATNSVAIVEGLVLGQNSATIPATNDVFGDPCGGTPKKLYVEAAYGTVRWTNDTPSIGLPASGTGTLPSFTAINSSCSPVVATITVIFNNGTCDSVPQTFTITVNPNTAQTTTTTACDSYTWSVNGTTYTKSGTYSIGTNCNQQILNLTVNKTAPPTGITSQISTSVVTLADLMVTGTNIKWYDTAVAGSELPNSTIASDNTSYYATQTLLGCESIRQAFSIHKISEATQTFCLNTSVNDLISTPSAGKTAKWYETSTEGNNSISGTTIVSSGTYYVQQHEPITPIVSTLAGNFNMGNFDEIGTLAEFTTINHLAVDRAGNIYAADTNNNRIRKITPAGVVSTFAGSTQGFADGTGTAAQFYGPSGIAIDSFDNLFVTDGRNNKIRKITPEGVVSTLAGSTQGDADGIGAAAQFYLPNGIAVDGVGNLYVTDVLNYKIKKIAPDGMVSTLAGTGFAGNTNGLGTMAQFNAPLGIALDAAGTLYVTEGKNSQIRKITPDGVVSTFAGSGVQGFTDGLGTAAQFNFLTGIIVDATGNLYVGDLSNSKIRKITPLGEVSTFAGSVYGAIDGPVGSALFQSPRGIALDYAGNMYVSDNYRIRKIKQNSQSNRLAVTIVVNTIPTPAPVASAQSLCTATTVADLAATGTTLQWYAASTDGAVLASTTSLSTGTYYVSQTINSCESPRTAVSVTINDTPAPTGIATQTFCGSETVSLLNATGTGIIWYDAATLGTVVPDTTVIVDGTTYYASQTVSGCESTTRLAVTATSGTCLGLDNFDDTNLQWYPNPTTGKLNISYSKTIEEVSVINLLGQTLFTNKTKANEDQLDLSKLPTASYFVKVVSEGKSKIIKVIKQ